MFLREEEGARGSEREGWGVRRGRRGRRGEAIHAERRRDILQEGKTKKTKQTNDKIKRIGPRRDPSPPLPQPQTSLGFGEEVNSPPSPPPKTQTL